MTTTAKPHGFVTRGIHWLSSGLLAYGYVRGVDEVSQLADPTALRLELLFALGLGVLFALRLIWTRTYGGTTRLPANAPRWEHLASRAVHIGLYVSVFGIILSGFGIAAAYSIPALSGVALSAILALHEVFLAALPVLLVVHVAGALWHRVVRRDGVLESMTGRLRGFG